MIFLDESGKRWKRIKHSSAGIVAIGTLPVIALVGGSLTYHPQWGVLPLITQAAGVVLSGSTKSQPSNPVATAPKQRTKTVAPTFKAKPQVDYIQAATTSNTIPAPTPSSTATLLVTAPTQPQPTTPTSGNPTKNDYGQSHKPVK